MNWLSLSAVPDPDIYTTECGRGQRRARGRAGGCDGPRRTEIQQADVAQAAREGAQSRNQNRQRGDSQRGLCFHGNNSEKEKLEKKRECSDGENQATRQSGRATRRGGKATRRGSRTHALTNSVNQRGGRELAARGGEGVEAKVGEGAAKSGTKGARGGRREYASGVDPRKSIDYIYDLAAIDRPRISKDHKTRHRTHTDAHHQTQAHRAQTQDNHPRTRTRRTILKSPNLEKIPRSLIRVPNACGRISQ